MAMKWMVVALLVMIHCYPKRATAQANEIAQLALNIEKLRQLKDILTNLERSYTILSNGYSAIKGVAEGNFSLHKLFLDGLYEVSPTVRNYRKVAEIVDYQLKLLNHLNRSKRKFRASDLLNAGEVNHVIVVYENLLRLSLKNLDELLIVTTAGKTRMSDDERLRIIDRIHAEMQDKLQFAQFFTSEANVLLLNRSREQANVEMLKGIEGLNKEYE